MSLKKFEGRRHDERQDEGESLKQRHTCALVQFRGDPLLSVSLAAFMKFKETAVGCKAKRLVTHTQHLSLVFHLHSTLISLACLASAEKSHSLKSRVLVFLLLVRTRTLYSCLALRKKKKSGYDPRGGVQLRSAAAAMVCTYARTLHHGRVHQSQGEMGGISRGSGE